jgi:hypothetical protein
MILARSQARSMLRLSIFIFEDSTMFQTIQRLALWDFLQALRMRYVMLFTIVCLTVVAFPTIANYLVELNFAIQPVVQIEPSAVSPIVDSTFPLTRTHQEPNFYQ